jgi:hypothetical protein
MRQLIIFHISILIFISCAENQGIHVNEGDAFKFELNDSTYDEVNFNLFPFGTSDFSYQSDIFFRKSAFEKPLSVKDTMSSSYKDGRLIVFVLDRSTNSIYQKGFSYNRKTVHEGNYLIDSSFALVDRTFYDVDKPIRNIRKQMSARRNGVWKYYNEKGILIKTTNWLKGDTTKTN